MVTCLELIAIHFIVRSNESTQSDLVGVGQLKSLSWCFGLRSHQLVEETICISEHIPTFLNYPEILREIVSVGGNYMDVDRLRRGVICHRLCPFSHCHRILLLQ